MSGAAGPPATSAGTRLLALLGHPVAHSLSPRLHSAAIAATGLDAVYVAFDVEPAAVGAALDGLVALGFLGANVTIPHKAAALSRADVTTEEARFVGAANTLWLDEQGRLAADNTDAVALRDVLDDRCEVGAGDPVVVLGAGGAARAAAVALGRLGAAVTVLARRVEAARAIADLAVAAGGAPPDGGGGARSRPRPAATTDPDALGPFRVAINATPLGRGGEDLPAPLMALQPGQVALDLNYGAPSPFLQAALARGARAVDGAGMLVGQAEAAFARWTGSPPPAGVMAAALG